jgi:hypothetical protein
MNSPRLSFSSRLLDKEAGLRRHSGRGDSAVTRGLYVRLIDSTITPNFEQTVLAELSALCLASLVTGPMIRETVQMARKSKALSRPADHSGRLAPSLLPDQTLAAEFVDIVVQGQGEDAC